MSSCPIQAAKDAGRPYPRTCPDCGLGPCKYHPKPLRSEGYADAVVRAGRIGSFAPGSYLSKCTVCGITFDGDKRAINCLPCAVERLKTSAGGVGQAGADGPVSTDNHATDEDAANGPTQIPPRRTTPVLSDRVAELEGALRAEADTALKIADALWGDRLRDASMGVGDLSRRLRAALNPTAREGTEQSASAPDRGGEKP